MASKSVAKRGKGMTVRGKLLSVILSGREWVAVVSAFTSKADEPVVSYLVPVSELTGSARRKADRWIECLS